MKALNLVLKSFVMVVATATLLTSCKDEEALPYVGTWTSTTALTKDKIVLTEKSYTQLVQLYNAETKTWSDFAKATGNLSADTKKMTITLTGVGMGITDPETGNISPIELIKDGDSTFAEMLDLLDWDKTILLEYSVVGKQLIVKADDDSDGVIEDDEITIYTKE